MIVAFVRPHTASLKLKKERHKIGDSSVKLGHIYYIDQSVILCVFDFHELKGKIRPMLLGLAHIFQGPS